MSKLQEVLETYQGEFKKLGISCNASLLEKVARGCGPSLYNNDASKVSSSDPEELERVKKNFLVKKLGLKNGENLDDAIEDVVNQLGKSNKNKYRAMFYYLLVEKFKKASVYS